MLNLDSLLVFRTKQMCRFMAEQETWTGKLKGAQSSWSDSVAQELAAESQKIAHAAAVAEPIKEESAADQEVAQKPEDSEETAELSQTEMLSYHKPIESQC